MPATSGSPRSTAAKVTAKSGAMPTVAEARDGPASRIASVKRTCETPGAENAGERERPDGGDVPVARDRGRDERDAERGDDGEERPAERVVAAGERRPERDGHAAEERGRAEREDDGVHQAGSGRRRASRRSVAAAAGSASRIPASITAQPAQPSDPSRSESEQHAEERRERRLEREHERGPRGRRAGLHPGRDEVAERPREDAGDDEREPDGAALGHRELAPRDGDHGEREARDRHLQERERARVVARREALHRDDLERLRDRVAEHERVAERRAAGHAVQQQQPGDRRAPRRPRRRRRPACGRGRAR